MPRPKAHLFDRLCSFKELEHGWLSVLAHYPKNKIPAELREFDRQRSRELQRLSTALRQRTFVPEPASLIFVKKTNHPEEQRPIALVRPDDRIVLTVLNRLLNPMFEGQFSAHSYAYRPGKGAWTAIERVTKCLRQGLTQTAAGDIDDFFSNIDRQRLLRFMERAIWERPVYELLETYLHMGTSQDYEWVDTGRGVAQGSPLSPLLSNLALADFDRFLEQLGTEWVRYADNFLLLGMDATIVRDCFERAEAFLLEHCGLRLNVESRRFTSDADGFEFLGFWFHDGRRTISAAKLDQKRLKIAEILRRHQNDLRALIEEMSDTVKGWRSYYGLSPDTRDQLASLEKHLFDLIIPWLERYRSAKVAKPIPSAELKAALLPLELPVTEEPRKKLKWAELVVARSRPKKEEAPHNMSVAARRAIEQRKKEYLEVKQEREEILITRPGTYLGRTGERLLIRRDGKREAEIPLSMIRNITSLTKAVSFSGDLMMEAASRGIHIVLAGSDGRSAVRIGPPELAEHQLSLAQSTLAASSGGLELAKIVVAGKIRNQANLLRYYLKYPQRRTGTQFLTLATKAIQDMEVVRESVLEREFGADLELERNRLFASEGQAAVSYWSAVRTLLWWKPGFDGRVRRGANDLVNSLLNYGYGILYSRLLSVLVRAGLNIYIGFLHKPQPGKAGLLYDFIEEFRTAAVDRAVFGMLNLGVTAEVDGDGLDSDTRHDLARKVIHRLQTKTRYHGEVLPLEQVMQQQAQLLVRHIEGKDSYQTYVLPW
jgi:CRISPR-associated endonuclease Cas1/group II intron reverse transcriptase/maturase